MLTWPHAAFNHGVEVKKHFDTAAGVLSILADRRGGVSEC